ncbi:hypothetical protein LEP1GSC125_3713 [Leptospira mayottensis 200901122]|uniref:Uncharacterized protein n=1 Tax=Leptospira mayottensis 200901122 TaxID=1193010 RepID=A0AA87MMT4_9LEPT|nr:hypothetical protein LEP1GSC125_3713 [Leptospira mayottensis 200901122]
MSLAGTRFKFHYISIETEGCQFSVSRRLKLSDNRIKFSNILCREKDC